LIFQKCCQLLIIVHDGNVALTSSSMDSPLYEESNSMIKYSTDGESTPQSPHEISSSFVTLSSDVLASICHWLNAHCIAKLRFCGSPALWFRLTQPGIVNAFIAKMSISHAICWPTLVASLPHLCDFDLHLDLPHESTFLGADLESLPHNLKKLSLNYYASWRLLCTHPEPLTVHLKNLRDLFPGLHSLRVKCSPTFSTRMDPSVFLSHLPTSLVTLRCPNGPLIRSDQLHLLPRTLTELAVNMQKGQDWNDAKSVALPPHLSSLSIHSIDSANIMNHLPSDLERFSITFSRDAEIKIQNFWSKLPKLLTCLKVEGRGTTNWNEFVIDIPLVECLPCRLTIFKMNPIVNLDPNAFERLPKTLTEWKNVAFSSSSTLTAACANAIALLPRQLVHIPRSIVKCCPGDKLNLLPPGLYQYTLSIRPRNGDLNLPERLQQLTGASIYLDSIATLPTSLRYLSLSACNVSLQLFNALLNRLKNLEKLIIRGEVDPDVSFEALFNPPMNGQPSPLYNLCVNQARRLETLTFAENSEFVRPLQTLTLQLTEHSSQIVVFNFVSRLPAMLTALHVTNHPTTDIQAKDFLLHLPPLLIDLNFPNLHNINDESFSKLPSRLSRLNLDSHPTSSLETTLTVNACSMLPKGLAFFAVPKSPMLDTLKLLSFIEANPYPILVYIAQTIQQKSPNVHH
jgi:hypothetical protein